MYVVGKREGSMNGNNGVVRRLKYIVSLAFFLVLRQIWQQKRFGPKSEVALKGRSILLLDCESMETAPDVVRSLSPGYVDVPAMTLSSLFERWLVERGASVVRIPTTEVLASQLTTYDLVAVTYEWFVFQTSQHSQGGYIRHVLKLRSAIRRSGKSPLLVAPDTYLWSLNLGYGLISSAGDGRIFVLQNTANEAHGLGIPDAVDKIFWTWPDERLERWNPPLDWSMKLNTGIIPGTGEVRRLQIAARAREILEVRGWTVHSSGGLKWRDYISQVKHAKILLTTSYIPIGALSSALERWRPDGNTTGRVWDGFAASCLVVTNATSGLLNLGFIAGIHYWDLDDFLASPDELMSLPDEKMMDIALKGRTQFLKARDDGNSRTH